MTLKRGGYIFIILSLMMVVTIPAIADFLGPNRTVTTYVWKRLHCRYQAVYDPPGAGWYGCYLNLYQAPDTTCPSTSSVVGYFSAKDCSWPSEFCQDPGCSITLSSSIEGCSEGQTGCRATETTVTHPPATVSGSVTCAVPGDNGWCCGGGQLGLSGTEPLSGYSILALEGTRNGETFACPGDSCSVPLLEGNNDFTFWALSSWGDSSLKGTANGKLDSSPPVISGELTGTAGEGGWYVSEVTVSANASDAASGVSSFEIALDGGGWAAYGGSVALTDGDHVVDLRAIDAAGNVSTQSQAVRVDTQSPTLTLAAAASFCPDCGDALRIEIDIQDPGSGVAAWTLSADGVTIKSDSGPSSETLTWNGGGLTPGALTLLLQARDVAGNGSEVSRGVTLKAPTPPPPPPPPTSTPSGPKEVAPVATATSTIVPTPTSSEDEDIEASPTPTRVADHKPTRTPSTFMFGGPPAGPPGEVSGEGLSDTGQEPGEGLTGLESAPGESLVGPEPSVGGGSSSVLWGAGAAGLIAAATAIALRASRRRKDAEERVREEMKRRNLQAEAREEAERQRLAALAAMRQKIARRLEEYEAMRREVERQRLEKLAESEEAKEQYMAALDTARQAMLNAAAVTTAIAAAADEARRREALRRRIERNLGLLGPTRSEITSTGGSSDEAGIAVQVSETATEPAKKPFWAPIALAAADAWFWYDREVNPVARSVVAEMLIGAHEEVEEFNDAMDVLRDRDTSIDERWDAIGEIADTGVNVATFGAWGDVRTGVKEGDWLRVASGAFGIIPVSQFARPAANLTARVAPRFIGNADDVARLTRTVAFAVGHVDDTVDLTLATREVLLGVRDENLGQVVGGILRGVRPGLRLTRDTLAYRASVGWTSGFGRDEIVGMGGPNYNWHNVPLDSLTIKTTDGIIVLPPDQWAIQGAGTLPGEIPIIPRSSTPEGIMFQIPADWTIEAQAHGLGVRFVSPDGTMEVRIHGPSHNPNLDLSAPSRYGWVARVQHYDPGDLKAYDVGFNQGWVAYNDLGDSVPMLTDAAHIPVLENPAAYWYSSKPTMREMLRYFNDLSRRLRGGP